MFNHAAINAQQRAASPIKEPRGTACVIIDAAGATAGTESAALARERYQPFEVAFVAAHPENAVFEAAALQVGFEFPVNMVGQGFALLGQVFH